MRPIFSTRASLPPSVTEYAPGGGNPVDEILPLLKDPQAPVMLTRADAIPEKYRHPMVYFKPALGLVLFREQILGKERFDYAFRHYIRQLGLSSSRAL
jgi:hypothetical protein